MVLRLLTSVILLCSVLFMPFWVSVILAIVGMLYFRYFLETAGIMLLSDLLYGVQETRLFHMVFISGITAMILILLVEFTKKKLRFY